METKRFDLRVVLTVTTDRLLTQRKGPRDNGISDLYDLLNWMTRDNLFTHQLPRAGRECKPWLLRWFPELNAVNDNLAMLDADIERDGSEAGCEFWLGKLALMGLPRHYDVPQIPRDDHEVKDAYDELVQMRGTDEGIVLVNVDDKLPS